MIARRGWYALPAAALLGMACAVHAAPETPALTTPAPAPAPSVPEAPGQSIGYLTGTELAARCKESSTAGISYCYAFITGVNDTMQAYERWLSQKEFCPPPKVPQGELRQNFLAYLNAYPGNGQGQAASVVVVALKTSYPCRPGG